MTHDADVFSKLHRGKDCAQHERSAQRGSQALGRLTAWVWKRLKDICEESMARVVRDMSLDVVLVLLRVQACRPSRKALDPFHRKLWVDSLRQKGETARRNALSTKATPPNFNHRMMQERHVSPEELLLPAFLGVMQAGCVGIES